jgi:hypothetical protein
MQSFLISRVWNWETYNDQEHREYVRFICTLILISTSVILQVIGSTPSLPPYRMFFSLTNKSSSQRNHVFLKRQTLICLLVSMLRYKKSHGYGLYPGGVITLKQEPHQLRVKCLSVWSVQWSELQLGRVLTQQEETRLSKKWSHPRNGPWRPVGMFPVRYEHQLHVTKIKLSP